HWGVNGIAFAGDYLSAASFLGICGMIAVSGFDGFLYAIGFLSGWIVALFLIAEPFKKLGKFTFTDALNAKFNSRAITLTAAISTLIISIFYLIPQMVGAGDLVTPLLGLPHWSGVLLVGAIVIFIVASAGMASTTYVQFIKGGLLILLSSILTFYIFKNGLTLNPGQDNEPYHEFIFITPEIEEGEVIAAEDWQVLDQIEVHEKEFVKLEKNDIARWFELTQEEGRPVLAEALSITVDGEGRTLFNGQTKDKGGFYQVGHLSEIIANGEEVSETGPVGPLEFLAVIGNSEVVRFNSIKLQDADDHVTIYYQEKT